MAEDPRVTNMPFVVDPTEPPPDPATLTNTMPLVSDPSAPKPDPSTMVTPAGDGSLPDTNGAAVTPVEPSPALSLPDTTGAAQNLPPPKQTLPRQEPPSSPVEEGAPARPTAPATSGQFSAEGVKLRYAGIPNAPYGRSATAQAKPFRGIVLHYTGSNSTVDEAVAYGLKDDPERGGAFGYHFYIGRDGEIVQAAPMEKRTNHVKAPGSAERIRGDLSNSDAIGISLVGDGEHPTPAQIESARKLGQSLMAAYGIKTDHVFGHGELQNDREGNEGATVAQVLRGGAASATSGGRGMDTLISNIKGFEGFTSSAKWDSKQYSVGYGTRSQAGETITEEEADKRLRAEVSEAWKQVEAFAPNAPEGVKMALASLTFNAGSSWMQAGLGEAIKAGDYATAKERFLQYSKSDGKPMEGLIKRRATEASWFDGGPADYTGPKRHWVDTAPAVSPAGSPEDVAAGVAKRTYTPTPSFWKTVEAAADESDTAYLFRDSPVFAPAPDYKPTVEELDRRKEGLPEKYWGNLVGVSPAHSDYLEAQARRQFENDLTIAQAGWTGTGVSLAMGILDPVDATVAIATGGLGAAAGMGMKVGAVGSRLMGAAAGAAGNVALTAGADTLGKATEGSDYAMAAAFGAGLGFAFGPLGRNPATEDIAAQGSVLANMAVAEGRTSAKTATEASPQFGGGGGLSAAPNPNSSLEFSSGDLMKVEQGDASRTAIETARPDMAGRLGASKNPSARLLGEALGLDVVNRKDLDGNFVVNPRAAGEDKLRIMSDQHDRLYSVAYPQFEEWANAKGMDWLRIKAAPRLSPEFEKFGDSVSNFIRDTRADRDANYDPQVVKAGKRLSALLEEHRQGNMTPRPETPDNPGRPLAGREDIPANPHYLPRRFRLDKINSIDPSGRKFVEWLDGAYLANHKELGDKAYTIAEGTWAGINRRAYGIDEFLMMTRDGASADVLRHSMKELGIGDADVEAILARLPKGSKPGFMHHRLDIDENYVHPRTGLKLSDFVENNAFELFDHYNHSASAWRAAGRIQLIRKNGEVVQDGFRSRQEINNALTQVKARGQAAGQTPKEIASDTSLLQEEFDRLLGVPHESADTRVSRGMDILRNLGTATFGGNFGISSIPDMARLATIGGKFTEGGLRAMLQHMPALRTKVLENGVLKPTDDLGRDLAAGLGAVDEIKKISPRRVDEDGNLTAPMDDALGKIEGASKTVADFVVSASGMRALNQRFRESARRVMADRLFRDSKAVFGGRFAKNAEAKRAIKDDIRQQLEGAGVDATEAHMHSDLVAARYIARGERLGVDPVKLFKGEGIRITDGGDGPKSLSQGELGQFAGAQSKTANIDDLLLAIDLRGKGFSPEDVWFTTGWGMGNDGKWRYEIPDDGGKFVGDPYAALEKAGTGQPMTVRDFYSSPELEAAYPDLFDTAIYPLSDENLLGAYDSGSKTLFLNPNGASPWELRSTLLHELQHAIQGREGFGGGSNPLRMASKFGVSEAAGFDLYRRTPGEVEARNTEKRGNWTAVERRASAPWQSADVPQEDQIAHFGEGRAASTGHSVREVDPNASEWTLYHGTGSRDDFRAFDPAKDIASPPGDSEHGAVFFTPDPIVAQRYAMATYDPSAAATDAHRRIIPVTVTPGKTRLFDIAELLQSSDPAFRDALRSVGVRDTTYERMRSAVSEAGVLDYEKGGVVDAALHIAKSEGLDTFILRGLNDAGTADQIVALTPGRVKAAYTGDTMFQGLSENYRGSITMGDSKALIKLFSGRDQSTFMHEMGHQWLGEMIQDAQVNAASKADLGIVMKWLGVDDPAKIGRKEHEQWAQGFEQYLREGKAPSPELTGAFQHFKAWLVRIYETIKGLGTPISDDIRGVMDRMLSSEAAAKFDLTALSEAERKRLLWYGLDDKMLPRVLSQMDQYGEEAPSMFGPKLGRFNPDEWTDLEAKAALATAVNRAAGRASMEHDFGSGTVFDRSPIFRTFAQLKRFALNAWHMNILHGYSMRDSEAFADVVFSTFAGAALYSVRSRIQAATQSDPQAYLDEKLTPDKIALAAFQLSAYSSLIPGLVDTGIGMTGANPLFGFRNSTLPSDVWFGTPSVAFLNNVLRVAPSALFQPIVMGRDRSQQEWRQMLSVLPFSNNIGVQGALSLMVRGAPAKPPKNAGFNIQDLVTGP